MVRVSAIFVPPYKSQDLLTYTFLIIYLRTHFVTYLKFQRKLHLLSGARYAGGSFRSKSQLTLVIC